MRSLQLGMLRGKQPGPPGPCELLHRCAGPGVLFGTWDCISTASLGHKVHTCLHGSPFIGRLFVEAELFAAMETLGGRKSNRIGLGAHA